MTNKVAINFNQRRPVKISHLDEKISCKKSPINNPFGTTNFKMFQSTKSNENILGNLSLWNCELGQKILHDNPCILLKGCLKNN